MIVESSAASRRAEPEGVRDWLAEQRVFISSAMGDTAAGGILAELRGSGCENVRVGETRPVHDAITYIASHRSRMNYAAAGGRPAHRQRQRRRA